MLCFLAKLSEEQGERGRGPHLVVLPLSVLSGWLSDLSLFQTHPIPIFHVYVHYGVPEEREGDLKRFMKEVRGRAKKKGGDGGEEGGGRVSLILTTFDLLLRDLPLLKRYL
ncbi:hypothetical protein EON64_20095, partial [archaeon]